MEVRIRPATTADLPGILTIVNDAILNTTAIYDYDARPPEAQTAWFEERTSQGFPVIVAEFENKIAGFGSYGTFREKAGYKFTVEHSVYVGEKFSGKGIGGKLLTRLIEQAKLENYHVMVGGIDASNLDSITFHKKHGFTETGTIREAGYKFGKWLDLLFMQLILD